MIGHESSWDQFVSDHRWAVLSTLRNSGSPVSSMVAYARDGDRLVVSTPTDRFKAQSIRRNPLVNLCVISNAEPFNYVSIEADATVLEEGLLEDTRRVFANIADTEYAEPEDLGAWIAAERRVILSLSPTRVFGVIR